MKSVLCKICSLFEKTVLHKTIIGDKMTTLVKEVDSFESFINVEQFEVTVSMDFRACSKILAVEHVTDFAENILTNVLKLKHHDPIVARGYINELLWWLRHDLEFASFVKCKQVDYSTGNVVFNCYKKQQFAE